MTTLTTRVALNLSAKPIQPMSREEMVARAQRRPWPPKETADMDKTFTDTVVQYGREHGFALGLKRAIDLLREHGVEVDHPARQAVFKALMHEKPTAEIES